MVKDIKTNEYSYGLTWMEGLGGALNGLSILFGAYQANTKGLISILLSILFITLYYILRQRDLKIYDNNNKTDEVPNIIYFSLSLVLFIATYLSYRYLAPPEVIQFRNKANKIVFNPSSTSPGKKEKHFSGISEYNEARRQGLA